MDKLYNSNGTTYEVLQTLDFNSKDKEYFKDSQQEYRLALLQVAHSHVYVVASFVGETSWGSGAYFSDLKQAVIYYNEQLKIYLGVITDNN